MAIKLNTLFTNVKLYGFSASAINYIRTQGVYTEFILPLINSSTRTIYITINNLINKYNNDVEVLYQAYRREIFNEDVASQEEDFEDFIDELSSFVNDDRWLALQSAYPASN